MSGWLRWLYNRTANFILPKSLWITDRKSVGGNSKQLRKESNKRNKHEQPCKSCKSDKSAKHRAACYRNRNTCCTSGDHCSTNECKHRKDINLHVNGCICSVCRDYNEYTSYTASISSKGKGVGSRIWFGDELRNTKFTDSNSTSSIEHITGISTGVTI